jgi:hypothetical protein
MRQSVDATYDHRETGDRFTVETRLDGKRLSLEPTCGSFTQPASGCGTFFGRCYDVASR